MGSIKEWFEMRKYDKQYPGTAKEIKKARKAQKEHDPRMLGSWAYDYKEYNFAKYREFINSPRYFKEVAPAPSEYCFVSEIGLQETNEGKFLCVKKHEYCEFKDVFSNSKIAKARYLQAYEASGFLMEREDDYNALIVPLDFQTLRACFNFATVEATKQFVEKGGFEKLDEYLATYVSNNLQDGIRRGVAQPMMDVHDLAIIQDDLAKICCEKQGLDFMGVKWANENPAPNSGDIINGLRALRGLQPLQAETSVQNVVQSREGVEEKCDNENPCLEPAQQENIVLPILSREEVFLSQ